MKKNILFRVTSLMMLLFLTGCQRTSNQTWENVKTASTYINRGIDSLWGKTSDSKLIKKEEEFYGPEREDFIALSDEDLKTKKTSSKGSLNESISKSLNVSNLNEIKSDNLSLFKRVHFQTDDHVVKEREDLITVHKIATYLKNNPSKSICVEGHCDQRAPAAYNMSLGARRANHIRVLLIKQGIDFNRIYTVSYGKERPLSLGNAPKDLAKNRRVEIKLHKK